MASARAASPCRIEVVEKGSGWPVPLVELRTLHQIRFFSDNAGNIAFDLPELLGRETWFDVIADGYEVDKDGFGYRGVRLVPEAGKTLRVEVKRTSLARCIGRLTGGGIFGESQKLGLSTDWQESGALGCDSIQTAVYHGRRFWIWGDTTLPSYPLGIFNCSGATTAPDALQTLEPPARIAFQYFTKTNGAPRGLANVPGEGPTWVTGLITLPDTNGAEHLCSAYMKTRAGSMRAYQWGLVAWDDRSQMLEPLRILWTNSPDASKPPPVPEGHPIIWTDETGKKWALFGDPFPELRCPATFEAWSNPEKWEALQPRRNLAAAGGGNVRAHRGSIAWNSWRKKFVAIFTESNGKPSPLGEVWFTESDSPFGPWARAIKVLSHKHYTFYNPILHPEMSPEGSPLLFFEGTYSITFSDAKESAPRYDYNQVLYRLDLSEVLKIGN